MTKHPTDEEQKYYRAHAEVVFTSIGIAILVALAIGLIACRFTG